MATATEKVAAAPLVGGGATTLHSHSDVPNLLQAYKVTGALVENIPRLLLSEANLALLASQRLSMVAIWLPAGLVITSITFWSATTAGATLVNQLFGLYDLSRNLLRGSVDGGAGAWAAQTAKTLALTSQYTVPASGLYYIGILINATTVPSIKGQLAPSASQVHGAAPILNGTSNTGVTALPNPATAIAVTTTVPYCYVS